MAARAAGSPEETRAMTERLPHFIADSAWNDLRVRRYASWHALWAMTARDPVAYIGPSVGRAGVET